MKRLGKYSGKIYDENYDISQCKECCNVITDEQANDERFLNKKRAENLFDCLCCTCGCPISQE